MTQTPAIGIDFGTTAISVGVYNDGKVEILPINDGNRRIASFVSYGRDERVVGDKAYREFVCDPENTIFNIKQLMGRGYHEKAIENGSRLWPFKIVEEDGRVQLSVFYEDKQTQLDPESIAAALLAEMKRIAEVYLRKPVMNAVVSVPAQFTDPQRQALVNAGKLAKLNIMKLISDPAAVALAYGLDRIKETKEKVLLVFDFGGGTLEVSIVTISQGEIEVKGTAGIRHFGGQDIDSRLMTFVIGNFQRQHQKNPRQSKISMAKLKVIIEDLKKTLSSSQKATKDICAFYEGKNLKAKIDRCLLEGLCGDLFKLNTDFIEEVLDATKYKKSDIDEVIMVGGSVKIPKIENHMQEYFVGKIFNTSINPEEAVTYGAVLQAAILVKDEAIMHDISIHDIYPTSLSINFSGGPSINFLQKFSRIPISNMQYFNKPRTKETSMIIKIFEGDDKLSKKSQVLGTYEITDLTPGSIGENHINILIELNICGILSVYAAEVSEKCVRKLSVQAKKFCMSDEQVEKLI